jgi:hypothetical protein
MLQVIPDEELTNEQLLSLLKSHRKMTARYAFELGYFRCLSELVKKSKDNIPAEEYNKMEQCFYNYERSQNFDEDPFPEMKIQYDNQCSVTYNDHGYHD